MSFAVETGGRHLFPSLSTKLKRESEQGIAGTTLQKAVSQSHFPQITNMGPTDTAITLYGRNKNYIAINKSTG